MEKNGKLLRARNVFSFLLLAMMFHSLVYGFTLHVVDPTGTPVQNFRWLVELDNTTPVTPGVPDDSSLSFGIHLSTATVLATGDQSNTNINLDPSQRYIVSVLPDAGFTNSGACVSEGQTSVTVTVNPEPIPTAQINVLVFHDNAPLNNAPDMPIFGAGGTEQGLEGFSIVISDAAGQLMQDAFGNMLGTEYLKDANGMFVFDGEGNPIIAPGGMGDGVILTDANGFANIKYLVPNKYGIVVVPPAGEGWIQTSTIEGTPTVDAWVKPDEPKYLIEFGPVLPHAFFGFVKEKLVDPNLVPGDPNLGTIVGTALKAHSSIGAFQVFPGPPIPNCIVGLNNLGVGSQEYLYAGFCNADSTFMIENVPPGLYEIVVWDLYLDSIFHFQTVAVPPEGGIVDIGDILAAQWFGQLEGYVFLDRDRDGFMDPNEVAIEPNEPGIGGEEVILRFRDGTVYKAAPTDPLGFYFFEEVFPWFKYLVVEVGFARYFATGATIVVDAGGEIPPDDGWNMPSDNKRTPQEQAEINVNTGNALSRTEVAEFSGEVLLEAMQLFADQSNRIDWGKDSYDAGENGGIAGIVFYATTRAENDPRYAAGEPWEPGIANVEIVLYQDSDCDGVIDDLNGDGVETLADVDNWPFGWMDGGAMGPEDVKRAGSGTLFNPGDAIQIIHTDSWDENLPTDCPPDVFGREFGCAEGILTWNQIRPGVFDGGYALTSYFPGGMVSGSSEVLGLPSGTYIVEGVAPPGLIHAKEEDKNVDFGDSYTPSLQLLPPILVGDLHLVPPELTLFPGVPAPYAGQWRPLPDRKQVYVVDGFNSAAEFFMFTYVPKAARAIGLATNDLANAFDPNSPTYGEKFAPPWLPISFRDFLGHEVCRVYSDEFGAYNALVPSTFTVNVPSPTGVSPQMLNVCINDPGPIPDPFNPGRTIVDPYFNTQYATQCYTLDFWPGKITYLDTPVIPVGAFTEEKDFPLDCEFPDGTPLIYSVMGPEGGPYVSAVNQTITISSVGDMLVPNPYFNSAVPGSQAQIVRDYGFGSATGKVVIGCTELTITSWSNSEITATVPEFAATTGQLTVVRGDNTKKTPFGVTMTMGPVPNVIHVVSGQSIQAAIDAAPEGALILVEPGTYGEMVILWKNLNLQGSGAFSTVIDALPFIPSTKLEAWNNTMNYLVANNLIDLLADQDPTFVNDAGAALTVVAKDGAFGPTKPRARADGFIMRGSTTGGGAFVNAFVSYFDISNNRIINNLGNWSGGVRIGHRFTAEDPNNDSIHIHYNHITQNTGLQGGGGVSLFVGSDNYQVTNNFICGNFSNYLGGGICHDGLSHDGLIKDNCVTFNESFFDRTTTIAGSGGGIVVAGEPRLGQLSLGTGSVDIVSNQIQGNLGRAGDGGAICAFFVNGQDVSDSPLNSDNWYELNILNNMIVNNVTALAGAIVLQDAAKVNIVNNTIANNDSTATAALAFGGAGLTSTPQPSGIASRQHSAGLLAVITPGPEREFSDFSNPYLVNNIIWQNRSFYYDPDASGTGLGGLLPNPDGPYWDLGVLPGFLNEFMDPQYCILTDINDYNSVTNISADPMFVMEYFNELFTASEFAEGGNFIDISFRPLTKAGDYHIQWGSPAIEMGTNSVLAEFSELEVDIDKNLRPFDTTVDIGADEKTPGNLIIDNGDPGTTAIGTWIESVASNPYGPNSLYTNDFNDMYIFEGDRLGHNEVYIWWTVRSSRSTNVKIEVFDSNNLLDTVFVNQKVNGGQWNKIGEYDFTGTGKVKITATQSGVTTCADAAMFVYKAPPLLDYIQVVGPTAVGEDSTAQYGIRAYFSDGSCIDTNADVWDEDSAFATINGSGLLTTLEVASDQIVNVIAQYTYMSRTRMASLPVTIVDGGLQIEVIIDNGDAGTTASGVWKTSIGSDPYGADSLYSNVAGATYTYEASITGTYELSVWWTSRSSRSTSVVIQVWNNGTKLDEYTVNQRINGGQWNARDKYNFTGTARVVIISSGVGTTTSADAVKFTPTGPIVETIIDNDDPGTTEVGTWSISAGTNWYGTESLFSRTNGDTYTYEASISGLATVYAWWTVRSSRSTSVHIQIWDGGTLIATETVNQRTAGGQWNRLGRYNFLTGTARIRILSESNTLTTCADAVRFVE